MKRVLITGGYGVVGRTVATLLKNEPACEPVIAGRNTDKARQVAKSLNCTWKTIDLNEVGSVEEALVNIDIVVNCFIPHHHFNTHLAQLAAQKGVHYLDVAAFNAFNERILEHHSLAEKSQATLITATGLCPGMPAVLLASNSGVFDEIDSSEIFFTSGGNMDKLSPLSLQGIGDMMKVEPKWWNGEHWESSSNSGVKQSISDPFNGSLSFYPFMVTTDLERIPEIVPHKSIKMYSGTESMLQGIIMLIGLQAGLGGSTYFSKYFLGLLRWLGKNKHENYSLKVITTGRKAGRMVERVQELNAPEEYLTALVPVLICSQLANGRITTRGAFTASEVMDVSNFMERLLEFDIGFRDHFSDLAEVHGLS